MQKELLYHGWVQCMLKTTWALFDLGMPILGTDPTEMYSSLMPKVMYKNVHRSWYSSSKPESTQMSTINRTDILIHGYYSAMRIHKYSHTKQHGWNLQTWFRAKQLEIKDCTVWFYLCNVQNQAKLADSRRSQESGDIWEKGGNDCKGPWEGIRDKLQQIPFCEVGTIILTLYRWENRDF